MKLKMFADILMYSPRIICFSLLCCSISLLFSVGRPAALLSDSVGSRESDYSIFSKGIKVGKHNSSCRFVPYLGKQALKYESSTNVNINLLVYSYKLENHEKVLLGESDILQYRRVTLEKGYLCAVEGKLDNGRFCIDVNENGARRTMYFDRGMYDSTTMECPEIDLKHEGDEMTLRLLDLETLMIVKRKYRWVKSEEMTVDSKKILCRVVDFEDANKKCRRWIHPDSLGVLIVRQDGNGKNGRYSLRLEQLKDGVR